MVGREQLFLLSYSTGKTSLYDAERDLLAIAKCVVVNIKVRIH